MSNEVRTRGKAFPLIIFLHKIMILDGSPNRIGQGIEFESQAASHLAKRVFASKNSQDNIANINTFLR